MVALVKIKSSDELLALLRKAYEIETGFESVAQWEGYVSVADEDMRAVLFELISDSHAHSELIESLMTMVRRGDGNAAGQPFQPRTFSFKGKGDLEVMNEIARIEKVMLNMYSDLRAALDDADLSRLLSEEADGERFISGLNALIDEETKHVNIVARYVRKVDRLR